jgi:putative ABC transport system permease protein
MKHVPLILRHLRHSWMRTAATVLAMVVCVFLFCTLETVIDAVNWGLRSANASRLVVRNAVSLFYSLPLTYRDKVKSLPGVTHVAAVNLWLLAFGGNADYFRHPAQAIDPEEYLTIYPEYILSAEDRRAFVQDRRGCIVGPDTAREFGWKVGDAIQLEDRTANLPPFELVVRGIYQVDDVRHPGTDARILFFQQQYLEEATGHRARVGFLAVAVDQPERAPAVSAAIDRMFEDSERQTRTETESAFRAGMVSMAGNLARLLRLVTLAVVFAILVVTANTMSMAVRERRREIAVLKALGFGSGRVMALVLAEALSLGATGGGLGVLLGHVALRALPRLPGIGWAVQQFPTLGLSLGVGSAGFGVAILLSLAAGLLPAVFAYRCRTADSLRTIR